MPNATKCEKKKRLSGNNVKYNKRQMGHNVEWYKTLTGNNVEHYKRRVGHNVEW
jgi:hypothetical protein